MGHVGADRAIPMRNAARSTLFYRFDPREQLRVWCTCYAAGEHPLAIYHSHTHDRAYPSRSDIEFACDPKMFHVIISTADPVITDVRAYRMHRGRAVPVQLVVD